MSPRSIALERLARAASSTGCLLGWSSCLPIIVRISRISLSISFFASSSSAFSMLLTITRPLCWTSMLSWRHNLWRISSHCTVYRTERERESISQTLCQKYCVSDDETFAEFNIILVNLAKYSRQNRSLKSDELALDKVTVYILVRETGLRQPWH